MSYEKGEIVEGEIVKVCENYVLVDLRTHTGIVRRKEFPRHQRGLPEPVPLTRGRWIKAKVLNEDFDSQGQVKLSMARMQPTPKEVFQEKVSARYLPGTIVTGTVTSVQKYGVFVELEAGVCGLLHRSTLGFDAAADMRVKPEFCPGTVLTVCVQHVEFEAHRMQLMLPSKGRILWSRLLRLFGWRTEQPSARAA